MITAAEFYEHFAAAGFTVPLTWGALTQQVNLISPDDILLGGDIQSREYEVEYPSTALPGLAAGQTIVIGADSYKVRTPPFQIHSGAFTRARLTKLAAVAPGAGGKWDFSLPENSGQILTIHF